MEQLGAYECKSWPISSVHAQILLNNLKSDRENPIHYWLPGDGSFWSGVENDKEKHNCLTWAREHLKRINIDLYEDASLWLKIADLFAAHPTRIYEIKIILIC